MQIKLVHYEEQADRWLLLTDDGEVFQVSRNFKDRLAASWLNKGHMLSHKATPDYEVWNFIQ